MTKTVGVAADKTVRKGTAAQINQPKSTLSMTSKAYNVPQGHEVLLKVQACGVCHSDSFTFEGTFPGVKYPAVPGHEIVGIVEEVGSDVVRLKKGDRVGVGWHGGHCSECESCLRGDFITCQNLEIPGITRDGGYAEYALFDES